MTGGVAAQDRARDLLVCACDLLIADGDRVDAARREVADHCSDLRVTLESADLGEVLDAVAAMVARLVLAVADVRLGREDVWAAVMVELTRQEQEA